MRKLLLHSVSLAFLLSTISCAQMQTSDFEVMIELPASRDCYGLKVMSRAERRIPRLECEQMRRRAIFLTSENYKMLKTDVQTNCQLQSCKQITGAADGLFLAIDSALQKLP